MIVPTKGRPECLRGCLAALARVDFPRDSFEVVVVNDGGGEATASVIGEFRERLPVHAVPANGTGPSTARNSGARAARGRFLALTDDDCEPAPQWLGALHRRLVSEPRDAVGGTTVNGARASAGAAASQAVVDALHKSANRDPAAPRFFASSNLALATEDFLAVGGFDEGFRYAEDREFCERWVRSGRRLVHLPDAVVHHMRTLTLSEFLGQHHGYGRGAWAYQRAYGSPCGGRFDVARAILRESVGRGGPRQSPRVAGYLALSQLATASGFVREACAERLRARGRAAT